MNRIKKNYEPENALYLVPTPIGNLDDTTIRAVKVLSSVDFIACEDTRTTGFFLKKLEINYNKLITYHEHNEKQRTEILLSYLKSGKSIALVSDAGSPLISDPGYIIVKEAIKENIKIIALPGATAFAPCLAASGFPINEFKFFGFPPKKKGRKKFLTKVCDHIGVSVLYESPHKIIKFLDEITELKDNKLSLCIGREITKIHEEYIRGTAMECKEYLEVNNSLRGEFTIVIFNKKEY
jgi:16S rRNA (cytidine1402-2'-O)-methyltransferase